MRLAYADPPYPGKAHLYPENTEVDHAALVERLREYDGWALSTDETNLASVLALCTPRPRVLAWCRPNDPPLFPYPIASWEPVICSPARLCGDAVRSYLVAAAPLGTNQRDGLTGQKPSAFCEWVIRCLGAERHDTMDDIFPGTGIMGETWARWQAQPPLFVPNGRQRIQAVARFADPLPGIDPPLPVAKVRDEKRGRRRPEGAQEQGVASA